MVELDNDPKRAESIVRHKMKSLYGIENLEVYECDHEDGTWCFTIGFFLTRGQDYEERKRCCVNENEEILWIRTHPR